MVQGVNTQWWKNKKGDNEGSDKALERCKQISPNKSLCIESFKPKSKG